MMASAANKYESWKARWMTSILEVYIMKKISQRKRYGGELVNLSQEEIDSEIKVPTIYAMLKRQVRDGLLEVVGLDEEDGITRGTSRKYYSLSDQGEDYLSLMEESIRDFSNLLEEITEVVT